MRERERDRDRERERERERERQRDCSIRGSHTLIGHFFSFIFIT